MSLEIQRYVHMKDGTEIYLHRDPIENPKAIVIVVHGGTGHCFRYNWVTEQLNSYGFTVYRYDQRSHGRSGGARGYIADYNMLMDDCNEIVDLVKAENPGMKVFTIGHSMGSIATLGFAVKYPGKVDGQVFTGVACRSIHPEMLDMDMDEYGFIEEKSDFSKFNKNPGQPRTNDPWRLNVTQKGMMITLEKTMKYIEDNIANQVNPTLLVHGELDILAPVENAQFCYDNISTTDKTLKILPGMPHGILSELDSREEVLTTARDWMYARL